MQSKQPCPQLSVVDLPLLQLQEENLCTKCFDVQRNQSERPLAKLETFQCGCEADYPEELITPHSGLRAYIKAAMMAATRTTAGAPLDEAALSPHTEIVGR